MVIENLNLFYWNEHNGDIHSKNVENIIENLYNYQKIFQKSHHFHIKACNNWSNSLENSKAADGEIRVKILQNCCCIFDIFKNSINESIETSNFPDS